MPTTQPTLQAQAAPRESMIESPCNDEERWSQGTDFTVRRFAPFTLLWQLASVHAGEDLPVELLRCHSVEWDRLDGA